ncbi:MAG: flagellar brake protein [Desulfuromonadaceae bacterium]|nr:flagellar brake protein [Desulfuromonadaceae bacterium]
MISFKDLNLQIGTRLQMNVQSETQQTTHYSELFGYEKEFLIVKTLVKNELITSIKQDDQVDVRIFSGNDVITFSCTVKDIFKEPYFYMYLSFPKDIKVRALRGTARVKVNFPAHIGGISKDIVITDITDISATGAGIIAGMKLGNVGAGILVSFMLDTKDLANSKLIQVDATICSVQQLPDKANDGSVRFFHGVSFNHDDTTDQEMLQAQLDMFKRTPP